MNFDTNADVKRTLDNSRWEPEHEAPAKEVIQFRTCLYKNEKALWHRWAETNDDNRMPLRAMIETEDGKIHFVMPWSIQFTDHLVERRHG